MKPWWRRCALVLSIAALSCFAVPAQGPQPPLASQEHDVTLPNGKSQKDEILRAEYQQNLKDAAQLTELAQELQVDLEKNDKYVLSIATLKKTEDIEKLVKKIRSRMRRN